MTDSSAGRRERDFALGELAELLAETLQHIDEVVARTTEVDLESGLHQVLAAADSPSGWRAGERPRAARTTAKAPQVREIDQHEVEHDHDVATVRRLPTGGDRQSAEEPYQGQTAAGCGVAVAHTEPASSTTYRRVGRPTVLYAGAGVVVTTEFFESDGHRFPLAELDDLERVEHGGWLQSHLYELWARFRDQRIRLFHSRNAKEFGQVCRALTRARELAGLA